MKDHEYNLLVAFQSIPLRCTFDELVEFVKIKIALCGEGEYRPEYYEKKFVSDRGELSAREKRAINMLRLNRDSVPNPVAEIESGLALAFRCKGHRPRATASLFLEIQACCERALEGVKFLKDCEDRYKVDRKMGGEIRHQDHNQARIVFVSLLEASAFKDVGAPQAVVARALVEPLRQRLRFLQNDLANVDPQSLEATMIRWLGSNPFVRAAYRPNVEGRIRAKTPSSIGRPVAARPERIEDHFFGTRKRYGPD